MAQAGSSAASDKGDHDVCGVSVEVLSPTIVDRRSSGVSVACGDLHITQRYAGVERGHDEPGAEHVRVAAPRPGRRPMDRTQRWAVRRSRRCPSWRRRIGPSWRSPIARSTASQSRPRCRCAVCQPSVGSPAGLLSGQLSYERIKASPRFAFAVQPHATEAVQTPARVNVTCVTPLGEEMASTP
jgi:hypothetical protein